MMWDAWGLHSLALPFLLHLVASCCQRMFRPLLGLWKSPSCSTRQTHQTPSCTQFASTFPKLLHCFIILCTSNPYRKPAWNFEPFFELFGKVNGVEISSMLVLVKTDRTMSCTASRSGNKLRCFTSFPIFSSKANVGCSTKDKSWFTGRSKMFKVLLIRKR